MTAVMSTAGRAAGGRLGNGAEVPGVASLCLLDDPPLRQGGRGGPGQIQAPPGSFGLGFAVHPYGAPYEHG